MEQSVNTKRSLNLKIFTPKLLKFKPNSTHLLTLYSGTTEANSSLLYIYIEYSNFCPLYKKSIGQGFIRLTVGVGHVFKHFVTIHVQCLKRQIKK